VNIQWLQDWSEWFQKGYNWRNFHLIVMEYEDEVALGNREIVMYLLGFGFRIYWHYADTALHRRIKKDMEDLRAGKLEGRPLEDIIDELENKP